MSDESDFECALCHDLLYQPCVPSCGHAFCRDCLQKVLAPGASQGSRRCPLCRRLLHAAARGDLATCTPFAQLLEARFPEAYARRREEAEAAASTPLSSIAPQAPASAAAGEDELGLFVLDAALPRQRLRLNVFEPRYRNLMRHALEGGRRFGMVGFDALGEHLRHGVEMVIEECAAQPGGRFFVQAVGVRAFHIAEATLQEGGYLLASVEWLELDSSNGAREEDVAAASGLAPLFAEWEELVSRFAPGRLERAKAELGAAPPFERPADYAIWAAALVNPLPPLGVAPEIRPATLAAADAAERLRIVKGALEASVEHLRTMARSPLRRVLRQLSTLPPAAYIALFLVVAAVRLR